MNCPEDPICQRCPAACEDDVCLAHERAAYERKLRMRQPRFADHWFDVIATAALKHGFDPDGINVCYDREAAKYAALLIDGGRWLTLEWTRECLEDCYGNLADWTIARKVRQSPGGATHSVRSSILPLLLIVTPDAPLGQSA